VNDHFNSPALDRSYFTGFGYDDSALYAAITEQNFGSILRDASCIICADKVQFMPGQKNAVLLPCKHAFHKNCIKPWHEGTVVGRKNTTCPTCRNVYCIYINTDDEEDYTGF
jgi:hypothetical protein